MKLYRIHKSKIFPGKEVFKMMDTNGVPLDTILDLCNKRGFVFDWKEFFEEASKSVNFNKKLDKLYERAKQSSIDVGYSDEWWKDWVAKEPNFYKEEK